MVSVALSELWQWFTGASNHSYYNFACGGRQSCCFLGNLRKKKGRNSDNNDTIAIACRQRSGVFFVEKWKMQCSTRICTCIPHTKRVWGMLAHSIEKRGHWSPTKNSCLESYETSNGSACALYTKETTSKSDKNWSPTYVTCGTYYILFLWK